MSGVTSQNPYQGVDNGAYVETEFNGGTITTAPVSNGVPPVVTVRLNYWEKLQKYQPQSRSIIGGSMLLLGTGLHMAWGLWHFGNTHPWSYGLNFYVYIFIISSFYVGAIMGNIVGIVLVHLWRKTIIYNLCGAMLALSGVIFIVWFEHYAAILAGRMLAGMSHGIVYIALIFHAGENTISDMRGRMLSGLAMITTLSAFLVTFLNYMNSFLNITAYSYNDMTIGVVTLVCAGVGIVLNTIFTYESVLYLLQRGQDREALQTIMKLRNESTETWSIRNDFADMRLMVSQEKNEKKNIFSKGNGRPVVLNALLRLQAFLSNNQVINLLLIAIVQALVIDRVSIFASPMILTGARTITTVVSMVAGDNFGRKWFLTLSGGVAGLAILIFGVLLMTVDILSGFVGFLVLFQVFVGYGIEPMQHVLISETFSLNKKACSIAFVTTLEYLLQIIAVYVIYHLNGTAEVIYGVLLTTGIAILILTAVLHIALPETRGMTLKQSRDEFRSGKNRGVVYTRQTNLAQGILFD